MNTPLPVIAMSDREAAFKVAANSFFGYSHSRFTQLVEDGPTEDGPEESRSYYTLPVEEFDVD